MLILDDNKNAHMQMQNENLPVIGWFSCGATSAVACKIGLSLYKNVHIVHIETGSEHEDNKRFIRDCEKWMGVEIETISSSKYNSIEEVFLKRKFINSPNGASCTYELKKKVRYKYEDNIREWAGQIWGFEFDKKEINRAIRFKQQNPNTRPLFPLIEKQLTKSDCLGILQKAGIKIPKMYELGYNNNNCIGCVKGGMGYWNKIRIDFPEKFQKMAKLERLIGATCLKGKDGQRIFLDELPPNIGAEVKPILPDCSISCAIEFEKIVDRQTELVLENKLSINDVE